MDARAICSDDNNSQCCPVSSNNDDAARVSFLNWGSPSSCHSVRNGALFSICSASPPGLNYIECTKWHFITEFGFGLAASAFWLVHREIPAVQINNSILDYTHCLLCASSSSVLLSCTLSSNSLTVIYLFALPYYYVCNNVIRSYSSACRCSYLYSSHHHSSTLIWLHIVFPVRERERMQHESHSLQPTMPVHSSCAGNGSNCLHFHSKSNRIEQKCLRRTTVLRSEIKVCIRGRSRHSD